MGGSCGAGGWSLVRCRWVVPHGGLALGPCMHARSPVSAFLIEQTSTATGEVGGPPLELCT